MPSPVDVSSVQGGAVNQSMVTSTTYIRGSVDINNDGTPDGMGTVQNGVLTMDNGQVYNSWTVRSEITNDDIFGDNGIQDTALGKVATAFENGHFFTGFGAMISGGPEILGNFLDSAVSWFWQEAKQEIADVYGQFWEVHTKNNKDPEHQDPTVNLIGHTPSDDVPALI